MQLREEEEEDLVEGQGVREKRRLAAAAYVVCVQCVAGLCVGVFMQRRQTKPVCCTAGL